MIKYVTYKQGQSIFDLCLQAYGTLDLLIKFCRDNNVTDTGAALTKDKYAYDTALVKAEGNTNIYKTSSSSFGRSARVLTESGGFLLTEQNGYVNLG